MLLAAVTFVHAQPVLAGSLGACEVQEICEINGDLYVVVKILDVRATAYTAGFESTGKRPGDPAYGITASGTTVREGRTLAVDPELIPLGARVYLPGKGLFVAEDIGGAIRGHRIDIYMEDLETAIDFGIRDMRAVVVEPVALYGSVWKAVALAPSRVVSR